IINNHIVLDGINFIYNNVLSSFDPSDFCHLSNEAACIKMGVGANNINIKNCNFSQGVSGERNAYIGAFAPVASATFENIRIERNTFEESSNSFNCAVGFCCIDIPGSFYTRTIVKNININDNIIDGNQSIIFNGDGTQFKAESVF